jgi:hypothetical protein
MATSDVIRAGRRRQPARAPAARTAAAAAAVGLALLAAGCGGSPTSEVAQVGSTATQTSASSTASTMSGAVAFSRCMRSHGVPRFPHPSGGAIPKVSLQQVGVSDSELQAAQQACKSLWPTVSATQQQRVRAQALRFSRCMRNHGIGEFPDPDTNGGIRISDSVENAPRFQAAMDACKPLPPPPNLGPPNGDG